MFEDVMVTREIKCNEDTPFKDIAVFLNNDKALQQFKSTYDTSFIDEDEIPLKKWFVCDCNEMFSEPVIESIETLEEFIEKTTHLLLCNSKRLDWARNIIK
jgi:hypothetical protein